MFVQLNAFLLGMLQGLKGYKLYNLNTKKIIISKHVVFDESILLQSGVQQPTIQSQSNDTQERVDVFIPTTPLLNKSFQTSNQIDCHTDIPNTSQQPFIARDRQRRQIKSPARFDDMVGYVLSVADEIKCGDPPIGRLLKPQTLISGSLPCKKRWSHFV